MCILRFIFEKIIQLTVTTKTMGKTKNMSDHEHLTPISIFPTLPKIMMKINCVQIKARVVTFNISPQHLSGFCPYHSTTSILAVMDDINSATDKNVFTTLVLLETPKLLKK